ncbi:hypothetical protein PENVUL_c038G02842 [Penicillium vulpinum]|uniref:Uncharacterized protein n=1 Tax=Penicillium vulpinum TaxID=29845 RepID=A0A1V6RN30_9EURO|nr:hypothetical protein PENVUL_c038G02842 [Penicillium vulpinum]
MSSYHGLASPPSTLMAALNYENLNIPTHLHTPLSSPALPLSHFIMATRGLSWLTVLQWKHYGRQSKCYTLQFSIDWARTRNATHQQSYDGSTPAGSLNATIDNLAVRAYSGW